MKVRNLKKNHIGYLRFLSLCIFAAVAFSSCADFFQQKVDMDKSSNTSSLYDLLTPELKIEKLDAPKELFVSQGLYSNKIEISWSAVKYASSYKIERAVVKTKNPDGTWQMPAEGDFELLTSSDTFKTRYTDTIIQEPKYTSPELNFIYYYRVFAQNLPKGYEQSDYYPDYAERKIYDSEGNDTGKTEVLADPSIYGTLLLPVSNVEASKGTSSDSITVKWAGVPDAEKYKVERGDREQGNFYSIKEVWASETEFADSIDEQDQGTEFYYKVYAINSSKKESCASPVAMGYSLQPGAPVAPSDVTVENGLGTNSSSLFVKWSAGSDANTSYTLYRTSSVDSVYKLLKPNATSLYEDKTAKPGIYYYYFVQAIKAADDGTGTLLKSAFSESGKESASPAYGFLLSPPDSVQVDDGSDKNHKKIIWSPAINSVDSAQAVDFKYNIYSDSEKNGLFDTLVLSTSGALDENGNLFAEVELKDEKFFVITTVNENGVNKESSKSFVAAPVPEAPEKVSASKTAGEKTVSSKVAALGGAFDSSLWKTNKNEVYPVLITWEEPEGGADGGYDVYRSAKPNSGFTKINSSAIYDLYYLDSYDTAKSGVFYYYKVVSLNSLGQGRKSNNPENDPEHNARGYGAITRDQWFREYNKNIASSQAKLTLMHKPSDLDKVGEESVNGNISGTLGYNAKVAGLGAEITMPYTNYADHFIGDDSSLGIKFVLNGNTDTTSNMSANGNMHETVQCYTKNIDVTNDSSIGNAFERLSDSVKKSIKQTGDTHYLCGMYPGYVVYDNLQIKGGAAGGGYYLVQTYELDRTNSSNGTVVLKEDKVDWLVGDGK